MKDFIQLKEDNVCRIDIKDKNGEVKGELEFDLEDIELPLRYEKMFDMHRKNESYVRHQFIIIDKRQDKEGTIISVNTRDKLRVIKEFYKRDMEALDLFLGEGKTQMILNIMGRRPYIGMFDDIGEALQPLNKILEKNSEIIEQEIKDKYKIDMENVIE